MARVRPPSKSKKLLLAAQKHDSLAVTRAAPAYDELAETREGDATSVTTILDAGEAIIVERGFARTTVEGVSERAGISLDVFHAHFAGKGALLRALNDRFVGEVFATVDAATRSGIWTTMRVRDVVELAVHSILDLIEQRQGLVRAFLSHGATDRALAKGLRKIGAYFTTKIVGVIGDCVDADVNGVSERAIGFSLMLSVALAHHCVLVGEDWAGMPMSRAELAAELTRAITAYLGAQAKS